MKPPNNQKKNPRKIYKETIPTHRRINDYIERLIPEGEESRHWWLWTWLKNNLYRKQ